MYRFEKSRCSSIGIDLTVERMTTDEFALLDDHYLYVYYRNNHYSPKRASDLHFFSARKNINVSLNVPDSSLLNLARI